MEPIRIEVDDPAEALRRIRAEVALHPRFSAMYRSDVLDIIDRHWPNGAQP